MNKVFAIALLLLGLVMCVIVFGGIADGSIGLKGGGEATRAHQPISFWIVTAFR